MSRAQTRTPSHQLVEASFVPSGLNATPSTAQPDPRRLSCGAPVSASDSRTRTVDAGYGDARSVRAEDEVVHASGRSGQYGHARAALHVPDLRESVRTGQHD